MAHVQKRTRNGVTDYRARYIAPDGVERCRTFALKRDADAFLTTVEHDKLTGAYVDPNAGRRTFGDYAEDWLAAQVWKESTEAQVRSHFRRHVLPTFGERQLASVRPSQVQAWVKGLSGTLAPATVEVVFRYTAGVFRAAVRDRLIAASPCDGTKLPKKPKRQVVPLEADKVLALIDAAPDRYRALFVLAAGSGMRQGECFGLTLDRVDFLRRTVLVDRQMVTLKGGPRFGTPKTTASHRTIPLPSTVLDELSRHVAAYPPEGDGLLFTTEAGGPLARNRFGERVWGPSAKAAELPEWATFHDLRHFYASALIRHGESVKVVQARLGHASAAETLDTYSHLWPDSDDRTRQALDAVLGAMTDHRRTTDGRQAL